MTGDTLPHPTTFSFDTAGDVLIVPDVSPVSDIDGTMTTD